MLAGAVQQALKSRLGTTCRWQAPCFAGRANWMATWTFAGRGSWAPLGGVEGSPSARGIALSTHRIAGSSYRVEARGPVSCRVPQGLARGPRSPLGRWASAGRGGLGAAWQSGGGGRSPGSLNSERWLGLQTSGAGGDVGSATPSAREQPRAGMTSSSPTRRLRSAFCMEESIDVAGIGPAWLPCAPGRLQRASLAGRRVAPPPLA